FKAFLFKTNALALAVGVIIGAAVGKVVSSLVADLLMPLVSLVIPSGDWRSAKLVLSSGTGADGKPVVNSMNYGVFFGNVVDFVIIAFCVFLITRAFLKEPPPPATKACPRCTETIALNANKCKFCTADLQDAATSA
ncbi:MAG: large conductance mechanosensitive channel protein, partial [Bryobacterales bacterium]|nr:large conductance mechanosensitive channel protein [Bryobacterales bacterium]